MNKDRNQNRYRSMVKLDSNKCSVCGDSGKVLLKTVDALMQYNADYAKEIMQVSEKNYGSEDAPIQPIAVPCWGCNGGFAWRAEETRERAKIPSSFCDKNLNSFKWDIYTGENGKTIDMKVQMSAVCDFVQGYSEWRKEGKGLYIWSSTKGSGKTFLASCICNSLIDKGQIGTHFVSASELVDIDKNSDGSGNYETDKLALLCNCELLVIDDVGVNSSEWMNKVLFKIIDKRYQNKAVTIFTSNLNISQLENATNDRIADRVNKMAVNITIPDCCIRAIEANKEKEKFLKSRGLL